MADKVIYGCMFNFTTSNHQTWKMRMEDTIYIQDLHEPIFNETRPSGKDEAARKLLNQKV